MRVLSSGLPGGAWRCRTWVIAAYFAWGGCGDDARHGGQPTGASCNPLLRYEQDVRPIMDTYCVRCHQRTLPLKDRHGAPGDHNFDSIVGVLAEAEHVDQSAGAGPDAVNTSMPPNGPSPSLAEREIISQWLACEAPELMPHEH